MHRIPGDIICVGYMLRYQSRNIYIRFDIRGRQALIDAIEAVCCRPERPACIALAAIPSR